MSTTPTTGPLQQWQAYAACWSTADAAREAALARHVSAEVRYRDPMAEVSGLDAFGTYMAGFADAFPGHRFEIDTVDAHHGRSLARWRQVDPAGETVVHGTSLAVHDDAGNLADITGFFLTG